jgi:hypothetical protein
MGQPLSEWRKRIHELLADGEWHELDPVVKDALLRVPPGPAFRHAEKQRERQSGEPRQRGDMDDAIAAGRRSIAMQSVGAAVRSGKLERKEENGKLWLRDPQAARLRGVSPQYVAQRAAQQGMSVADDLADELRRQLKFWRRSQLLIAPGGARDEVLGGNPEQSIINVLKKHGYEP